MNRPRSDLLAYILLGMLLIALPGCSSTVAPDPVTASQASFDGNEKNSGIVSAHPNGFVVTAHFVDRYNSLVRIYGRDFTPPLKPDVGILRITAERSLIDRQHLSQFLEMNAWHRAGLKPRNL